MTESRVYTDNPLKQGLKLVWIAAERRQYRVYTDNPLKQGLKRPRHAQGQLCRYRLHGQSIKTRVEASRRLRPRAPSAVYTDNPLKQGLKLDRPRVRLKVGHVYTDNPLKQGLKLDPSHVALANIDVYTDNPLKQGLKRRASHGIPCLPRSTRTIH